MRHEECGAAAQGYATFPIVAARWLPGPLRGPRLRSEIRMSFWKQLTLSLMVLVVAGGAWLLFFPGARGTLERWGLDWAAAAIPERNEATGEGQPRGGGFSQQPAMVVASSITTA